MILLGKREKLNNNAVNFRIILVIIISTGHPREPAMWLPRAIVIPKQMGQVNLLSLLQSNRYK